MVIAEIGSGVYNFFLFLHLVAVVIGFGGVLLNGLYGMQAKKRPGPGGLAITEANFWVTTKVAEPALYLVPVFGFALIGVSDSGWKFSQTWIVASLVLYVIGLLNGRLVIVPTVKNMIAMMQAGPPDPAKMEAAGKRLGAAGGVGHLIFTVIMILMIWKPGL